jgi:hypothetical protein
MSNVWHGNIHKYYFKLNVEEEEAYVHIVHVCTYNNGTCVPTEYWIHIVEVILTIQSFSICLSSYADGADGPNCPLFYNPFVWPILMFTQNGLQNYYFLFSHFQFIPCLPQYQIVIV